MKCFSEATRFKIVKEKILDEHNLEYRIILRESETAQFSGEFHAMHNAYVEELKSIESVPALDDFLLEHRGLTVDEWIETL